MLPPLGNVELCFLLVQAVLLYRILRDLNLIDLDRLLAVIKPPDGSTALVSMGGDGSTCISDEALTKEQRQTFVKLNSGGSRGFHGDELLRALVHCDHNEAQTDALLLRNRSWLDLVKPKQVTPAQLGASLQAGALSLGGFSRCGWPIVEVQVERWQPDEPYATEQARDALLGFAYEHALQRLPAGQDRLLLIIDLSGWGLSHGPLVSSVLSLMQGAYVERLGVALLVNAPALFRASWGLTKHLLSERVASRVVVLGTEWQPTVAEHIDDDNLPQTLGGKHPPKGHPAFGFL